MPRVLISDAMDNIAEKILLSNNIEVDVITNFTPDELIKNINNYDGLIVRSATKVTKEVIENAKNLKVVGRAGAGVDNIDINSAKEKNIIVMNTPGGNTNATAEHTLALLLSLSRKISKADLTTHKGEWAKKSLKGNEIKGKTIEELNQNIKSFIEKSNFNLDVNSCLENKEAEDHILEDRIEGAKKFEVNATPTLIINGEKFDNPTNYKKLKKYLEKLI